MKVYLSGAGSVGKSTLARYIVKKYNLPRVSEVARSILSEKELQLDTLRADLDVVNDYQEAVFYRQLEKEQEQSSFVSDRSIIDCLAYSGQHSTILSKLLKSNELAKSIERLKSLDCFVFFIRPNRTTIKQDGIRETLSWDGIIAIDAQIKLLLEMFDIRYFQIGTDSMQERTKFVDAILSTHYIDNDKL